MSWQDSIGSLAATLGQSSSWNHLASSSTSYSTKLKTYGYDYGSHNTTWSNLASGRLAPPVGAPKPDPLLAPASNPPAKLQADFPTSYGQAHQPVQPPQNTQGDVFGSIAGAVGSVASNLSLANVVPWFMERTAVLAHQVADAHVAGVSDVAGVVAPSLDTFINGTKAASDAIAPWLNALPDYVRDGQLHDRAKVYQALVNGGTVDFGWTGALGNPLEALAQLNHDYNPFMAGIQVVDAAMGQDQRIHGSVTAQANALNEYRDVLLHSVDPAKRLDAQKQMELLREAIDIPQSVKIALENDPQANDEAIHKAIESAPEGKAWSYRAGPEGIALNLATPLVFYGAEARAFGLAGAGVSAFGSELGAGAAAGSAARYGSLALEGAGKAVSTAAAMQKWAFRAGFGTTILTTTADAVARTLGDQQAVDWFDKANRTALFSEDPNVQLVTSFSVNPLDGAGKATKGVISLAHGAGDVAVGAVLGKRYLAFYNSDTFLNGMVRRMYNLPSDAAAAAWIDDPAHFANRGQAFDDVMKMAAEDVVRTLRPEEQAHIAALPALERTKYTLETYIEPSMNLLKNEPDAVVKRWQTRSAQYHDYIQGFEPEVAAANAADFRGAESKTLALRSNIDAVVGYRESLPPEAQSLSRDHLDSITLPDGTVPTRGLSGINGLIKDFPVLRKYWQGKITSETHVPKDVVSRMIDEATADYARLQGENPIRARTGRDPVLRPSSPSLTRDFADAVGTNIDTINAIYSGNHGDATTVGLARKFLDQNGVSTEALTPEEVMAQADTLLTDRVTPWYETGKRVETAEKRLVEYRRAAAVERQAGRHGSARLIDAEAAKMAQVIAEAGDPLRPFAEQAFHAEGPRFSKDIQVRAARKVDARVRLGVIESIRTEIGKAGMDLPSLDSVVTGVDGRLAWSPDVVAAPPSALVDAFGAFKTANQQVWKRVRGQTGGWTRELQLSNKGGLFIEDLTNAPAAHQWAMIAQSDGFVARLRSIGDAKAFYGSMTGNELADLVEASVISKGATGQSLDQVAAALGLEPKVALQKLSEYKRAYTDALDGRSEAALRQTRDRIKVSEDAIAQAEADRAVRETVFDAEYEAWGLPEVTAKVAEITANPSDEAMWTALRPLMEGDDAIASGLEAVAARAGVSVDDVLADPSYASAVRAELVPPDFVAPTGRTIREDTALDTAIVRGDDLSVEGLAKKYEANPPIRVTRASDPATLAKRIPKVRKSYRYASDLAKLGVRDDIAPSAAILDDPRNAIGLDVMSILNYGVMGTRPQTLGGVVKVLELIENRHASAVGIGTDLAAEAQRVARRILDDALHQARTEVRFETGTAGTIGHGVRGIDHMELAEGMTRLLKYDDSNPLATLQYGLKKRPKNAVVLEMSAVPGLAEELMSKSFKPFEQRVWTAEVRQVYNYVFGPTSNANVRAAVKQRFIELAAKKGVDAKFSSDLYDTWRRESKASHGFAMKRTETGAIVMQSADNPLYADVWNIPNDRLNIAAHGTGDGNVRGLIAEMSAGPSMDAATAKVYRQVDFADLFRTAGSATKRGLTKVDRALGTDIAHAYGMAAHNKAATTLYYLFRFGLDLRFHAQNYFEAQILGLGMAGFRKREVEFGQFGMDSNYLHHLDSNEGALASTGYPLSRSRHETAYNVFARMHGDPLRKAAKGLAAEDPALMQQALEQVRHEPVTADMIAGIKANPDTFIKELDAWHAKMLRNVSTDGDKAVIDQEIADAMAQSPELAEVLAKLGEVNKGTWDDIRKTIYGNPDRSRAERLLNSYWLYWPLSYQIKSVKWLAHVLFDSAGGLKTNAGGAWLFDQVATTHQQQLATNPEYQAWFEKHKSLVFIAQMLMPIGFDNVGVSLNPFLRDIFFGARKEVAGVGPIYTWENVVKPVAKEAYADLYPTFGDGLDGFYALTGQQPTKAQSAANAAKKSAENNP